MTAMQSNSDRPLLPTLVNSAQSGDEAKRALYKKYAFFGLVAVQVSIGLVYKLSQTNGKYSYNPASALVVSELMKLLLSLFWTFRDAKNFDFSSRGLSSGLAHAQGEISRGLNSRTIVPMACLAALYALNNNLTFVILALVDPGTLNLVKSGATFISALILTVALNRRITHLQWLAIGIQTLALMLSQYDSCRGTTIYAFSSYLIMFGALGITCVSGVWNEHILKSSSLPLTVVNVYLYFFGILMNYAVYLFQSGSSTGANAGFFSGYSLAALLVIFCNSIIGVVITAVYKYADVVIKNIAASVSTAVLYVISTSLFAAPATVQTSLGYTIVFMATYLYMAAGNLK